MSAKCFGVIVLLPFGVKQHRALFLLNYETFIFKVLRFELSVIIISLSIFTFTRILYQHSYFLHKYSPVTLAKLGLQYCHKIRIFALFQIILKSENGSICFKEKLYE